MCITPINEFALECPAQQSDMSDPPSKREDSPQRPPAVAENADPSGDGPAPPAPIVRVLVIDDDRVTRTLLRLLLARLPGCVVTEAVDGLVAREKLQHEPLPDLCITDFTMPEIDGLQLLQQIRAMPRWRDMEVVLCTSSADRDLVTKAASLRVAGYIVKPFDPAKLIDQIRAIVARVGAHKRQMLDALRARTGLDTAACGEAMVSLQEEIHSAITSLRHYLSQGRFQAAKVRLSALARACSILPESVLGGSIPAVAAALESDDLAAAVQALETLESESDYLRWLVDALRAEQAGPPAPNAASG